MRLRATFKLTSGGAQRIKAKIKRTQDILIPALRDGINNIVKPKVIAFAPTPRQEAETISRGITDRGTIRGTPQGRFYKHPDFVYVREAIARQRARVKRMGELIIGEFGRVNEINPRIGFFWMTKTGHMSLEKRRSDDPNAGPAWKNLIWAWERGEGLAGEGFTVTRRPGDIEEGRLYLNVDSNWDRPVTFMHKKIPGGARYRGYRMFEKGGRQSRMQLKNYIKNQISQKLRAMR